MPHETIFNPAVFDFANLTAEVYDTTPPGVTPPVTIIRTDQDWLVRVNFDNVGAATGMIGGEFDVHLFLEVIGPGVDHDLIDPASPVDHLIPLVPGPSPVSYSFDIDVPAGTIPAPAHGGALAKLVFSLTYNDLANNPGPIAAYVEGPILQFYQP